MADHCCFIVPPQILMAMAESSDPEARQMAAHTLACVEQVHAQRVAFFQTRLNQAHQNFHSLTGIPHQQSIIPDVLLEHISQAHGVDDVLRQQAQRTLQISQRIRGARPEQMDAAVAQPAAGLAAETGDAGDQPFFRGVYDMQTQGSPNRDRTWDLLPGQQVRVEGQPPTQDQAVNEAYDSAGKVLDFYKSVFGYISVDNQNLPITSSVHFSKNFGNAFWLGDKSQMVYGDGNTFIHNFTSCIDVIGHEMTHGVTSYNSALQYQGESGALNEHISDVFGIMVKQMSEGSTAETSDWLIGEGCLLPGVKGVALRNMKSPGTAYDDPRFGSDIQPASYTDIAAVTAKWRSVINRDSGGVHIFSGIPNRAFVLCALGFGGNSWEKAGQIWWTTVTTHRIPPSCTFMQFADATVDVAGERFGEDAARVVRGAWNEVGVVRAI